MKNKVGIILNQLLVLTLSASIILPSTTLFADTTNENQGAPPGPAVVTLQALTTGNEARELVMGVATNSTEARQLEQFFSQNLTAAEKTNPNLKPSLIFVDQNDPSARTDELVGRLSSKNKKTAKNIAPKDYEKISFTQKISDRWKTAVANFKTQLQDDPSLIIYTLVRGSANGAFTAWTMHRYEHIAPAVAVTEGLIILAQSGLIMYNVNLYLKWLLKSKSDLTKFVKSDALEMGYLFLPQLILFLTGQQHFDGLKSLTNYTLSATMGTAQQMPMDGAIGEAQKRLQGWSSRGDTQKRRWLLKHAVRSASLLASILEIGVAFAQMLHLPMARVGFYVLAGAGWGVYLFQRDFHKNIYKVMTDINATLENSSEKFLKENSCRGTFGLL